MPTLSEEAITAFDQARTMMTAQAFKMQMSTPEGGRDYVMLAGTGYLCYGLQALARQVEELSRELEDVKRSMRSRLPGR